MTDDTQRLIVSLEARLTKYEKDMARAKTVTSTNFKQMEDRAKQSATTVEQAFSKTGAGIRNTFTGIGSIFAGIVSAKAAQDLVDSSIKIQNQLKTTGLAGKDLKDVYDALFASAQKNATPLEALVTLYSRTSGAAKDLGASQAQLIQFTDGVSLAMRVSGQSASESAGALLQLAQALGDGKIQAEEYNSLLDAGRPILQAVASGMTEAGGSISNLTRLVRDGKVSSAAFFNAFLAGLPTLQSQVANSESTISSSFVRLQNVLIDAAKRFNESGEASRQFSSIIDQVAASIAGVNFDDLVKQIDAVTTALNNGVASLNEWAAGWGRAVGANKIGDALIGALPGNTTVKSYLGGLITVPPTQDQIQDRIDGAFGTPSANEPGLTAAQRQARAIDSAVNSPSTSSNGLTVDQIKSFASRSGAIAGAAAAKGSRLPAANDSVNPVTLADYPVPGGSGSGAKGGGGGSSRDSYARELEQLKERTQSLQAATAAQAALNPLVEDYGEALATAQAKQELLNAAQKQNKTVTPEMSQQIDATAKAYGKATAAAQQLQQKQDDVKRSAEEAIGTARDVTKGLITDLASGKSGAEALSNALAKIGDAILNNVLDKVFTLKNFGGLFGVGGGQAALAASGTVFGLFADGGYTGDGGKHEPAGVVHRGEYVMSKAATRRIGVENLEALHSGALRGYADGGYVGSAPAIRRPDLKAANSNSASASPVNINTSVTVNATGGEPAQNADLAARVGKQMEQQMRGLVADELRRQTRPGNYLTARTR